MLLFVLSSVLFFFFKQKTAYEMRISDWSSDVCSSDLDRCDGRGGNSCLAKPIRAWHHAGGAAEGCSCLRGTLSTSVRAEQDCVRQGSVGAGLVRPLD